MAAIINLLNHHFDSGIPKYLITSNTGIFFHWQVNEGLFTPIHQDTPSLLNVLNPFLPFTACLCHPLLADTLLYHWVSKSRGSTLISYTDWFAMPKSLCVSPDATSSMKLSENVSVTNFYILPPNYSYHALLPHMLCCLHPHSPWGPNRVSWM